MTTLSNKQRKILKKLLKNPLTSFEEDIPNKAVYAYLNTAGYLTVETETDTSELANGIIGVHSVVKKICVSEKGKAYLYEHRMTSLCFTIPTIISLASLVISIFALFVQ